MNINFKENNYLDLKYCINKSNDTSINEEEAHLLYKHIKKQIKNDLKNDNYKQIIVNLVGNPATPYDLQEEIMSDFKFKDYDLIMSFANNPNKSKKGCDNLIEFLKKISDENWINWLNYEKKESIKEICRAIIKSKNFNKKYKNESSKILIKFDNEEYERDCLYKTKDINWLYDMDEEKFIKIYAKDPEGLEKMKKEYKRANSFFFIEDIYKYYEFPKYFDKESLYNYIKTPFKSNLNIKTVFDIDLISTVYSEMCQNECEKYLTPKIKGKYKYSIMESMHDKKHAEIEVLINNLSKEEKIKMATTSNNINLLNKLAEENDLKIKMAIAANENINMYTIDHLMHDLINKNNNSAIKDWMECKKDEEILFNILMQNKSVSVYSLNSLILNMSNRTLKTEFTLDFDIKKETNHYKEDPFYMVKSSLEELLKIMPKNMLWYYIEEISAYDNEQEKINYINAIFNNPNIDKDMLEYIYINDKEVVFPDKKFFIEKGITEDDYCDFLYKCKIEHNIINEINNNQNISKENLEKFSKINNKNIALSLAKHSNITPEILGILLNNENEDVRNSAFLNPRRKLIVVSNKETPSSLLSTYIESNDIEILAEIIKNPNCTQEIVNEILKNKILENESNKNTIIQIIESINDTKEIESKINKEDSFSKKEKENLITALKENNFNQLIEEYALTNEGKAKTLNSIINSSKKFTIPEKEKVETLVK